MTSVQVNSSRALPGCWGASSQPAQSQGHCKSDETQGKHCPTGCDCGHLAAPHARATDCATLARVCLRRGLTCGGRAPSCRIARSRRGSRRVQPLLDVCWPAALGSHESNAEVQRRGYQKRRGQDARKYSPRPRAMTGCPMPFAPSTSTDGQTHKRADTCAGRTRAR